VPLCAHLALDRLLQLTKRSATYIASDSPLASKLAVGNVILTENPHENLYPTRNHYGTERLRFSL